MSIASTNSMTLTAAPTQAGTPTPSPAAVATATATATHTATLPAAATVRPAAIQAAMRALPGAQGSEPQAITATPVPINTPTLTQTATLTPTPTASPTVAATAAPSAAPVVSAASTQAITAVPTQPPASFWAGNTLALGIAAGTLLLLLLAAAVVMLRKRSARVVRQGGHPSRTEITEEFAWSVGASQHIGTRENQEDSFAVSNLNDRRLVDQKGILAVVADGVGGMDDGQIASRTVIQSIMNGFVQQVAEREPTLSLLELACNAHRDVQTVNRNQGRDCGTTLVMGLIRQAQLYILSIGDSRIYLFRDGGVIQLNREHVYGVELDEQVALGNRAAPEGMNPNRRKAILSYVGMEELRLIDRTIQPVCMHRGDRLLLLTDGVFGTISEAEITGVMDRSAQDAANALREAVLARGKKNQDNLTAVVIACD